MTDREKYGYPTLGVVYLASKNWAKINKDSDPDDEVHFMGECVGYNPKNKKPIILQNKDGDRSSFSLASLRQQMPTYLKSAIESGLFERADFNCFTFKDLTT